MYCIVCTVYNTFLEFFRMLPLRIAALRKRIQRPSYVPVDRTGNRVLRTKYLLGAEATGGSMSRLTSIVLL